MSASHKSGHLWLADGKIHYESADYGSWSFPVANLKVFGEYTNDNGPALDDWFMVFVAWNEDGWYEASVYADRSGEFRRQLARAVRAEDLYGELAGSTDYASRVIWPAALQGQPLFSFTSVSMPWWRRLLRLGVGQIRTELSSRVLEYAHVPH